MQVAKLSVETWRFPVHAPGTDCTAGTLMFVALNVTVIVVVNVGELPVDASAGVVLTTSGQAPQEPPQSMPVSVPFCTVSVQLGAWQMFPVQTLLVQSLPNM